VQVQNRQYSLDERRYRFLGSRIDGIIACEIQSPDTALQLSGLYCIGGIL